MAASRDLQPLLLHAHTVGPNPMKVAIVLEHLALPYTVQLWCLGDGPNGVKNAKFLAINENGRVPALVDPNTGVISWESGACINYLMREYDAENKLGPRGSKQELVDYDKWFLFLATTLGPMMGQLNWYRYFNDQPNENALQRYQAQVERTYDVLEKHLEQTDGTSILQQGFSALDAHYYPWMHQAEFAGVDMSRYPLIFKWRQTIKERPDVEKAYQVIGSMEAPEESGVYAILKG